MGRIPKENTKIIKNPKWIMLEDGSVALRPGTAEYLRHHLRKLLDEHKQQNALPTSARFLFYELVQRKLISKEKKDPQDRPEQPVTNALTDLRKSKQIPWEWIVDETRHLDDYTGYTTINEGLIDALEKIRLDPWNGQSPLVITESRSLAGVLRKLAQEYCIQIAATNGQVGGFLRTDIIPILEPNHRILYFGDLDLAGLHIEQNTRSVLEEKGKLRWERLALTEKQIQEHKLPEVDKYAKRLKRSFKAYETEALSQTVIMEILRSRLQELLAQPLATVLEREREEREELRKHLS
jgi:hypothetical protein